jgi:hypothetical protein
MGEGAHCFRHWRCWCHPNRAAPALRRALADLEPVIREAARWAIDRIEGGGE